MKNTRFRHLVRTAAAGFAVAAVSVGTMLGASMTASAAAAPHASAGQIFTCTPGKVVVSANPIRGNTQLYDAEFGQGSLSITPLGTPAARFNSLGYNPTDGLMYAIASVGTTLYQIDATGDVTDLGDISGVNDTSSNFVLGAFDNAGNYWAAQSNGTSLYKIDTATASATAVTMDQSLVMNDFTYSDGFLWGIGGPDTTSSYELFRINPTTGHVESFAVGNSDPSAVANDFVGAFTYGNGNLGFYSREGAALIRVVVDNPASTNLTATEISTQDAPSGVAGDAASCFAAVAVTGVDLQVTIDSPPAVPPSTDIDYTAVVHNNGPAVSSGWTTAITIPSNLSDVTTNTPGCAVTGALLSCTGGTLAAGSDVTIEFTGTAPETGMVTVPATVYGNEADTDPANDNDSTDTQVADTPGAPMVSGAVAGGIGGGALLLGGTFLLWRRRKDSAASVAAQ